MLSTSYKELAMGSKSIIPTIFQKLKPIWLGGNNISFNGRMLWEASLTTFVDLSFNNLAVDNATSPLVPLMVYILVLFVTVCYWFPVQASMAKPDKSEQHFILRIWHKAGEEVS